MALLSPATALLRGGPGGTACNPPPPPPAKKAPLGRPVTGSVGLTLVALGVHKAGGFLVSARGGGMALTRWLN
ncbi:MAG: hypothetical protein WCP96_21890 [Methylococcaceae bacterium]